MRVRWSSRARRRAADIVDYIARDRPQAALDWIDGLERAVSALDAMPMRGQQVPEWSDPDVRQILYGDYRIIYEIRDDSIDIMTIKHGRQDLGPPT